MNCQLDLHILTVKTSFPAAVTVCHMGLESLRGKFVNDVHFEGKMQPK